MSLMSFILIEILLFILFDISGTITCPSNYNNIQNGCYKVVNGLNVTWSNARQLCWNDIELSNQTVSNGTKTHLVAIENMMERNSLTYWLKAYGLKGELWIDGILSTSTWNWSNQSIVWFFTDSQRNITGTGSNYKLVPNADISDYLICDDVNNRTLGYICEYQVPCNANNQCQNGATCYSNVGDDVCVCAPGYTGKLCDTEIDECLSSPCLHDGNCINAIDNYTCDCSTTFYEGPNCETPQPDPTEHDRLAAFWSVLGIVTGLVVLLTLTDLPWDDIWTAVGCSCRWLTCCSKQNDSQQLNDNDHHLSDSPTNDHNYGIRRVGMPDGPSASKGMNYHVMKSVWDTEYTHNQTPANPQYNGYRSPDRDKTPVHTQIQSFASDTQMKQKQKSIGDNRVYAVNINEPKSQAKDSVDTMVNWTQQLQEQLKTKKPRETSANSTKQLIHSTNSNDY